MAYKWKEVNKSETRKELPGWQNDIYTYCDRASRCVRTVVKFLDGRKDEKEIEDLDWFLERHNRQRSFKVDLQEHMSVDAPTAVIEEKSSAQVAVEKFFSE